MLFSGDLIILLFSTWFQPDKTLLIDCNAAKVTVLDGEGETPGRRHHSRRQEVVIRESKAIIKHTALHKTCDQKKAKYGQQERKWIKNTWEVKPFIIQAENGQREAHTQKKHRVGEVRRKGRQKAGLSRWKGLGWWYF